VNFSHLLWQKPGAGFKPIHFLLMSSPIPFQLALHVEAADIDQQGHVNNLVYLRWVQDVATAHWQSFAAEEDQFALLWVVMRHEIDYMVPALLGDELLIRTWVGKASGLTFERHTEIVRAADEQKLARARTLWCPLSTRTGRPQRISARLRAQFSAMQSAMQ
jgi:acyl-CoA thioester hydrolase